MSDSLYEFHMARAYRFRAAAFKCEADACRHDTLCPERKAERIAHCEAMASDWMAMAAKADAAARDIHSSTVRVYGDWATVAASGSMLYSQDHSGEA